MPTTEVFIYDRDGRLVGIRIVQEQHHRWDRVARLVQPSEADKLLAFASQPVPKVAHNQEG